MNFDFPDDCKAIASELRRVLARHSDMAEVRRCLTSGEPSRATWQALAELGVLGAHIPERWGGSGLGCLELAAAAEEVGRACAPVATLASVYGASEALLAWGSDAQRERWLPLLSAGKAQGSWASPDGTWGAQARLQVSAGRASGSAACVPHGATADVLVVLADAGPSWLITLEQNGITRQAHTVLDPGLPLATLTLANATVEALDAPPGAATTLRDRAAALLAFEQLGGADRALDMARGYTLSRRTFGRTVASYQAVKHRMADMWAKNELARGHAYQGAWALAKHPEALPLAACGARLAASEAFEFAAQENLQLHGGIGYTWEADCHPLYKRARSTAMVLGSATVWKRRLARLLLAQRAACANAGLGSTPAASTTTTAATTTA